MITIENSLHGTNRELPDTNVGDTIPAHQATRVWMELCGYIDCAKCGPLGEHGPQQGFIVVEIDRSAMFISPAGDDFKDMTRARASSRKPLRSTLRRSLF